ncbi:MAG: DNA primase [Bacillota bacterium]|nr:DNA primase [Bacillota bacterium]
MANIYEIIKTQLPVSRVIGEYIALKGHGPRYTGLCPFHGEKTPSFSVDDEKGFYYCFGCKATGDVIRFVQEQLKLDPIDACKYLAERYKIDLSAASDYRDRAGQKDQQVYLALKDAALLYHKILFRHAPSKEYLKRRGLNKEAVQTFLLGYAPRTGLVYDNLSKKYPDSVLLKAGIISRDDEGRFYDRFRDRVMFPIVSQTGKVVGFGGRALGNSPAKYLNSADSPYFKKGELLYALNHCKDYLKEDRYIIVVEGYMDVVSLFMSGIRNVVATLGTACTEKHAHLLKRYTDEVVLCYDSDSAGIKAALKAVDILSPIIPTVRVCLLGEGLDPDDYVKKYGPEEFKNTVKKAKLGIAFKIDRMSHSYNLEETASFNHFLKKACHEINQLGDQFDKSTYAQYLIDEYDASAELIKQIIKVGGLKKRSHQDDPEKGLTCEEQIIKLFVRDYKHIIDNPSMFAKISEVPFSDDLIKIFYAIINHFEEYETIDYAILADELGIELTQKLQMIMESKLESRRMEVLLYNIELQKINEQLEQNPEPTEFAELSRRKSRIISEILKFNS